MWDGVDQWRTFTMNVGGAKRNYMEAEGAKSKYFFILYDQKW
jgi:hypothetical protein